MKKKQKSPGRPTGGGWRNGRLFTYSKLDSYLATQGTWRIRTHVFSQLGLETFYPSLWGAWLTRLVSFC